MAGTEISDSFNRHETDYAESVTDSQQLFLEEVLDL